MKKKNQPEVTAEFETLETISWQKQMIQSKLLFHVVEQVFAKPLVY